MSRIWKWTVKTGVNGSARLINLALFWEAERGRAHLKYVFTPNRPLMVFLPSP